MIPPKGVKGQNVSFFYSKFSNDILLQITWYGIGFMHIHQLHTLLTKVIGLEIHLILFGVTGVKLSFSPKMLFLLHITCYAHAT